MRIQLLPAAAAHLQDSSQVMQARSLRSACKYTAKHSKTDAIAMAHGYLHEY